MVKHDDYMTPFSTWEDIRDFLPRHLTIWEAFRGDRTSAGHSRNLGLHVVCEDVNFFAHDLGECVVTNPPFSKLTKVLARLRDLGKPFDADHVILPGPVPGNPGHRASEPHPVQEAGGRRGGAEWAVQLRLPVFLLENWAAERCRVPAARKNNLPLS